MQNGGDIVSAHKVKISSYWYQRKPYLEWKLQRDLPEEEENKYVS